MRSGSVHSPTFRRPPLFACSSSSSSSNSSCLLSKESLWWLGCSCFLLFLLWNVKVFYVLNSISQSELLPSSLSFSPSFSFSSTKDSTHQNEIPIDYAWGTNLYAPTTSEIHLKEDGLLIGSELPKELLEEEGLDAKEVSLQQMRICIATREIVGLVKNSGIATAFYELAKSLASRGANVTLLSLGEGGSSFSSSSDFDWWEVHYSQMGVRLLELNTIEAENNKMDVFPSGVARYSARVQRYLLKYDGDYEVVHFADNLGEAYYSLITKTQGWGLQTTTFIVGLHGVQSWAQLLSKEFPSQKQSVTITHFERRTLELADMVVSPSRYMVEYLLRHRWRLPIARTIIIPNLVGVKPNSTASEDSRSQHFSSSSNSLPIELIFYGRLEPRKGIDLMVGALELLGKRLPSTSPHHTKTKITFLGRDLSSTSRGPMSKWITAQWQRSSWKKMELNIISDFGRQQSLAYINPSSGSASYSPSLGYRRLVVIPSLNENSPYTVLECLTLSIPFIATRVGGIPELIHPDDVGDATFDPTSEALFKKLLSIFTPTSTLMSSPFRAIRVSSLVNRAPILWSNIHKLVSNGKGKRESLRKEVKGQPFVRVCLISSQLVSPHYGLQVIAALQQQTYKSFEVVYLFDGTNNTILEKVESITKATPEFSGNDGGLRWSLLYLTSIEAENRGLSRNLCANQKGKNRDYDYLFFLKEEDLPQRDCLARFVEVAERMASPQNGGKEGSVLTSFSIEFTSKESPLERLVGRNEPRPRLRVPFGGGDPEVSLSLALLDHYYFSDSHLFVSRNAFIHLGGFTTYLAECEVYEFFVRALLNSEVKLDIVPAALLWSRTDSVVGPPKDKVQDHFLCHYRASIPLLNDNRFGDISDFLLYSRGMETEVHSEAKSLDDKRVGDSVRDFSGVQGQAGWFYGFFDCHTQTNFAASIHEAASASWDPKRRNATTEDPVFFFDSYWTHADSEENCPFLRKGSMCPYNKRGNVLCPFRVFRPSVCLIGTLRLRVAVQKSETLCGDGVLVLLSVNNERLWQHTLTSSPGKNEQVFELAERTLLPGDLVSVVIDPLRESNCDSTAVHLIIDELLPCSPAEMEQAIQGQAAYTDEPSNNHLTEQQRLNLQMAAMKKQRRTTIADSLHDFGGPKKATPSQPTQRDESGWSYGFYHFAYDEDTKDIVEEWRLVSSVFNQTYHLPNEESPFIGKTFQQPSLRRSSTVTSIYLPYRRYTARQDLEGSVLRVKIDSDPNPCGDGVLALLRLNSDYVIWWSVVGGGQKESDKVTIPISLQLGDSIELVIDPRGNSNCDSTAVSLVLARNTSPSALVSLPYPPDHNDTWKDFTNRKDEEVTVKTRLRRSNPTNPKRNIVPFLLLFNIRSGSTWLVSMLRQITNVKCEEELLWSGPTDPIDYIIDFYSRNHSNYGSEDPIALGFKTAYSQWVDRKMVINFLAGRLAHRKLPVQPKIVYLKRNNRLKAVISILRAGSKEIMEECGVRDWHLAPDKRKRDDCNEVPISINPQELLDWLARREFIDIYLDSVVGVLQDYGLEVLQVTYEELLTQPQDVLEHIVQFLFASSSPSEKKLYPQQINREVLLKITNDDLRKSISNFEELERALEGNPYQEMLYRDVEYKSPRWHELRSKLPSSVMQ